MINFGKFLADTEILWLNHVSSDLGRGWISRTLCTKVKSYKEVHVLLVFVSTIKDSNEIFLTEEFFFGNLI